MNSSTWKAEERRIAAIIGGQRVGVSGIATADAVSERFCAEVKVESKPRLSHFEADMIKAAEKARTPQAGLVDEPRPGQIGIATMRPKGNTAHTLVGMLEGVHYAHWSWKAPTARYSGAPRWAKLLHMCQDYGCVWYQREGGPLFVVMTQAIFEKYYLSGGK